MFKHQIFSDLIAAVRSVCTYVISIMVLGTIGSLFFWYRHKHGTVVIHGLDRYHREIVAGKVIIASNHPTILESMLLLFMCWPRCLWQPRTFFPWSMPDKELFYKMGMPKLFAKILYSTSNSIPVERSGYSNNLQAYNKAKKVLENGKSLIVHPEAGRTGTLVSDNDLSTQFIENSDQTRRVRDFSKLSHIPKLALETDARILPVYIDIPFWKTHDTFTKAWSAWSTGKYVISIHVGKPYVPETNQSIESANHELALHIVNA